MGGRVRCSGPRAGGAAGPGGADRPSQQGFDSVPQVRRGREAHCVCDVAPGCGEAQAGGQLPAPADGPGTLAGLPTAARAQVWRVPAVRARLRAEGLPARTSARRGGPACPGLGRGARPRQGPEQGQSFGLQGSSSCHSGAPTPCRPLPQVGLLPFYRSGGPGLEKGSRWPGAHAGMCGA